MVEVKLGDIIRKIPLAGWSSSLAMKPVQSKLSGWVMKGGIF